MQPHQIARFIDRFFFVLFAGTKFPFIMKLCFSSSKNMNSAWNNETSEIMDGGELLN